MNKQQIRNAYETIIRKYGFAPDFDLDQFDEDETLQFACRNNGDVGEETYGELDYRNAIKIEKELIAQYGAKVNIEPVDEWVIITIEI